jgi:hypothetical protein
MRTIDMIIKATRTVGIKPMGIGGEKEIENECTGAIERDLDLGEEEVLRQAAVTVKEEEEERKGKGKTITQKKTKDNINRLIGKSVSATIAVEVGAEAGDNSNVKLYTSVIGIKFESRFLTKKSS